MCDFRSPHPTGNNPPGPSSQKIPKAKILPRKIHSNSPVIDKVITPNAKNSVNDNDSDDFEHEYEIVEPVRASSTVVVTLNLNF